MWMLIVMLHSSLSLDAMKPVETFYQTEKECQDAMQIVNDKGNFSTMCLPVTWK